MRLAEPHPLPVDHGTMSCEVKDRAGNVCLLAGTLALPEWLHVPDDLIAGIVRIHARDVPFVAVDTLRVGQLFDVSIAHREWTSTGGLPLSIAFYVDGVLARTVGSSTSYPAWRYCRSVGVAIANGFTAPGPFARGGTCAGASLRRANPAIAFRGVLSSLPASNTPLPSAPPLHHPRQQRRRPAAPSPRPGSRSPARRCRRASRSASPSCRRRRTWPRPA